MCMNRVPYDFSMMGIGGWAFSLDTNIVSGNKSASPPASIVLNGMAIQPQHAVLHNSGNKKISIEALSGASILINGKEIKGTTELQQNDRLVDGKNEKTIESSHGPG